ncbi:MAG: peptidase M61 [Saprospiraceae bacterium]
MKKILLALWLCPAFMGMGIAQRVVQTETYQYNLDLKNVRNDRISVELICPAIDRNTLNFNFPKTVPGTYSVDDYGRYIHNLVAEDASGNALTINRLDSNRWQISNAATLYRIRYDVEDSFDAAGRHAVFEPAGSNIEERANYLINTHCFFGYFDGLARAPFQVRVLHDADFYGSTALTDADASATEDLFKLASYNELADSPMMYCQPDTAIVQLGDMEVLISIYSPNRMIKADYVANHFKPLLDVQRQYLGGKMPVKRYAFLIYVSDKPSLSGGWGALEHSLASVYFIPEQAQEQAIKSLKDVAAHEFFHIITPLFIHAEEIHNFDFIDPKMSEHLWLYEGVTEYCAHHAQVKYGLTTEEEYLGVLRNQINISRQYFNDTLSFTEMSRNVLDEHHSQFGNVYQKGALIGMCLDVKLLELSGGKYDLQRLMRDLSKFYGAEKPFRDEELFPKIAALTYPEIGAFLKRYVAGKERLPLSEVLASVGVRFESVQRLNNFSLGGIGLGANLSIINVSQLNAVGKQLGYLLNDKIVRINGEAVTPENFQETVQALYANAKVGDKLKVSVEREGAKGRKKVHHLKGKMQKVETVRYNQLAFDPNATPQQLALRKVWLKA